MSCQSFHKGAGAEGGGGRLFVNSASVGAKNKSEQQISRKPKLVQDKVSIQVEIAVRQCGKRFELSKKYPTTFFVHLFFFVSCTFVSILHFPPIPRPPTAAEREGRTVGTRERRRRPRCRGRGFPRERYD